MVLDTCGLIWLCFEFKKLSKQTRELLLETQVYVPSICLYEIGIKVRKKKLKIPLSVAELTERLHKVKNLSLVSIDDRLWLESLSLDWGHWDPVDRLVVALAKRLKSPIVTTDREIQRFYNKILS